MGLLRGKIAWTIPGAGTAHSVFHFQTSSLSTPVQADADDVMAKMVAFRSAIRSMIPSQISLRPLSDVEEIHPQTGALIGVWGAATQTAQTGSASATASWAAPVGGVISWSTAGIRNSRRVRGRTFVVPMSSVAFDTDGTLNSTGLAALDQGAAALKASTGTTVFSVWARPTAPGAADGDEWPVLAHRVPDVGAILTSRRS